jgi:hypothetical protein
LSNVLDSITLGQVRALNEVANATKAAVEEDRRLRAQPIPPVGGRDVRKYVGALARLNVVLEACMGLDIYEEAHSIADQAGVTPEMIDRLTDPDVWQASERMIREGASRV